MFDRIREKIRALKLNVKFTVVIFISTAIPFSIMAAILFHSMESSVVREHIDYMEYKSERNQNQITTSMDILNMSTQFFMADEGLCRILVNAAAGKAMTTQEILDFHDNDMADLERLVNSNPLLYTVRVFANNDRVQEMMPVLYRQSRMEKLSWASTGGQNVTGWHFGYTDTAFSSLTTSEAETLACLVSEVEVYGSGVVGYIEAALPMKSIFPGLYEEIENEWGCFVLEDRTTYFGTNGNGDSGEFLSAILELWEEGQEQTVCATVGGKRLVVSYQPIKELGGTLVDVEDISEEIGHVRRLSLLFAGVMVLLLAALACVINRIVKRMLRQFYSILKSIHKVQQGDLSERIEQYSRDEMGELSSQLNRMLDRIEALMEENIAREVLAKNSEIRALQNQINAHFIYNVLESIKMMAEIDEEYMISDAITSLGKLLRYSMRWVSGNVRLEEELEYIRNYLSLINLRYDFEVTLSLNIPDMLMEQEIPKMSLQPVVENAILHGIDPVAQDNTIYIKGWTEGTDCIIEITDAGKGMTEEELQALRLKMEEKVEPGGGKGNGIGLKNVQDRIRMAFGEGYGLSFSSKYGCYTKVAFRLPGKKGV